ncbi:MAG: IS110 family transposase [Rhodospirillales bacterium]|nr:IS110 family transposase [Rhodospirillales bacterium]
MDRLTCFAGVDWGSETHQVCIVERDGAVSAERSFRHGGAGLAEMADWILARTGAAAPAVRVAIEVPHGPVVETLMERGFAVHSVNPKQLDRFRDRFSPAGAKDDRRDARTLADALRTDGHAFRHLDPAAPAIIELREWSRIAHDLTGDRTRLVNRARQQLWRYYPQLLKVESDLTRAWIRELWGLAPTPAKAQRVRASTVARLLRRHRVRRINAEAVLRVPASAGSPISSHLRLRTSDRRAPVRVSRRNAATAIGCASRCRSRAVPKIQQSNFSGLRKLVSSDMTAMHRRRWAQKSAAAAPNTRTRLLETSSGHLVRMLVIV